MNTHYLRLVSYLEDFYNGKVEVPEDLVQEFLSKMQINKSWSKGKEFKLMLSNIGRPTCQLQYEKLGTEKTKQSYNAALRNAMGDFSELWLIMMMKAAGIPVEECQKPTYIVVKTKDGTAYRINGRLDITIDGGIYDIKTASKYSFAKYSEKGGIEAIIEEDSFGYVAQGFGYAEGEEKPFRGWWVINKDNGLVALYEIPQENYEKYRTDALEAIQDTVETIHNTHSIENVEKLYGEFDERYYNKPTGNRKLGPVCSMCSFRKNCWPDAVYAANPLSKGKSKTYNWYTYFKENETSEI